VSAKLPYKEWQKCRRHPEQVAATCSECYDAALVAQDLQLMRERRRLHREYLARRAA
jgi:hypothetical protein